MDTLTYVSRDTMTDIADAIREKSGSTIKYAPTAMAAAISALINLEAINVYVGDYADSDTFSVESGAVNVYGRYITT